MTKFFYPALFLTLSMSCATKTEQPPSEYVPKPVQLVTLDPGHFHAALVQKTGYPDVDSTAGAAAGRAGGFPVARPPAFAQHLPCGAHGRPSGRAPRHRAPAGTSGGRLAGAAATRAALPAHLPLRRMAGTAAGAVGRALAPHRLPRCDRRRAGRRP